MAVDPRRSPAARSSRFVAADSALNFRHSQRTVMSVRSPLVPRSSIHSCASTGPRCRARTPASRCRSRGLGHACTNRTGTTLRSFLSGSSAHALVEIRSGARAAATARPSRASFTSYWAMNHSGNNHAVIPVIAAVRIVAIGRRRDRTRRTAVREASSPWRPDAPHESAVRL